MASYVTPKKNTAFVTYVMLEDQANAGLFKSNPTLAAGDAKVAIDDGAPANLATLPAVDADFQKRVKVSLSADEMNGDNITVLFSDAAGDEWYDLEVNIQTTAQQVDDLATSTALATVDGIVDDLLLVAPDNKPTVGATGEASANVTLWKDAAAPDAPPSNAQFEARTLPAADYTVVSDLPAAAPTAAANADAVWDELLAGHAVAGSAGAALTAAGAAGDPWATELPGSYGGGTAGKIIGSLADIDTSSVTVVAAISGSTITILRGDTLSVEITGLGDISTRSKLWFTAKISTADADSSAIVQIEETLGLVYLNGAAGTGALGDITVTDEDAGDLTITLDETATDDLVVRSNMSYDVQVLTAAGAVRTLTTGTLHVTADVTRAVA